MEVQVPDLSEAEQTAMTMVMVGAMMGTMLSVPVWSGDQASVQERQAADKRTVETADRLHDIIESELEVLEGLKDRK